MKPMFFADCNPVYWTK